jgi:ABC-type transporter Mla subunit MlaD
MARLMHTASEAPKAAAEVIAQLREQMSQLAERDNASLAERADLVGQIGTLLQQVQQTTGEQRAAIENLVGSATGVLDRVGKQFADTVGAQAGRAEAMADQAATSAAQLAALGEAFQQGTQQLATSHEQLVRSLQRVEGAIGQSLARSDEQLAYYVAQAREVIDLSISAQQGIVEDLRQLRGTRAPGHAGTKATAGAA